PVPVTALPHFDDGWVSVQDAAAQLAADFVAAQPGQRVLDACAAPGGKSAHLLERASGELDLTALDSDAERLGRVHETLARLGFSANVVHADASRPADWWDGRAFDRILLDAPCSATGVIRRHPDIRHLRKPGDLPVLAKRQRALLDALWPLLAPGGRLVYATCSVLKAENTGVVNDFLSAQSNARAADELLNDNKLALMVPQRPGVQILPGSADFDGFYYACIVRQTDTP
ncbi:MAG: 16S rRNA (cytosine(967)-C(5))-methyltransferase RsmB, partial [Pseudomonadota bacterium]